MIIYLEGPDGSGKTTLANHLYKALEEKRAALNISSQTIIDPVAETRVSTHPAKRDRVTEKELYHRLKMMATDGDIHIMDRGPISDIVYRIFDNFKSVTTINKLIDFIKKYNKRIFIVYCRTKNAEEAMNARGDDNPVALERHKELSKVYDFAMSVVQANTNKYNFAIYDWSNRLSINEITGELLYFAYLNTK